VDNGALEKASEEISDVSKDAASKSDDNLASVKAKVEVGELYLREIAPIH
jgi:hypothetical protein